MLNTSDIIRYSNDLWISQEYIVTVAGIDDRYIRVAKSRANAGAASWKYEIIANKCYFRYSALPRMAATKLPDVGELSAKAVEVQNDIVSIVSRAIYSSFKLFLKHMSEDEARSAAVVHEASIYVKSNNISFSKSAFFVELAAEIKLQGLKYLPVSWRNLRDKIEAYDGGTHITDVVYAKNKNNTNRCMFTGNDTLQNWLVDLGDSGKNFSAATIYRKISLTCDQHSVKAPSQRWVSEWLAKPETQFLISQRYGSGSRFNHKYRSYTPTASALYAGDCWEIDGTRVNIIDHKAVIMKDGQRKTANKFLYIVAVRDVMSGHVLGWEYCHEESSDVIINALAMAARNAGYLPYEFRYDKFPGHNTIEWMWMENELRKLGVTMTQTTKAEGKAHIERWWGTLQNVFMVDSALYYGEGIKSTRRYGHRSKEYIVQMRNWAHKQGFNFDDASRETDKILTAYVSTPFSQYSRKYANIQKSPLELHNECTHPNTFEMSYPRFCYLFGIRKEVSVRNFMIQTQIDNATYYYGIDDVEVAERFTGVKVWNCFDPENFDKVHLFENDKYLGTYSRITPAQQYGPNKDMRAVGKVKAISEKMKTARNQKLKDIQVVDYEEEVSAEVGAFISGRAAKLTTEQAETILLQNEWEDEGESIKINIRNKY